MTGLIWAILAFAFAALGSKVLLGLWAVWIFLPDQPECGRCDGFTTPIETHRALRPLYRLCRIQHRWCPACGEHFLARGPHAPRLWVGQPPSRPDSGVPQRLERRSQ